MSNAKIYDMTDTWTEGATAYTAIKMDVTDTASAAGSKLLDLQVGSTSVASVAKSGALTLASGTITANEPALNITQTWNNAGVTFEGVTAAFTDTASAVQARLISLKVGAEERFSVNKTGSIFLGRAGGATGLPELYSPASNVAAIRLGATEYYRFNSSAGFVQHSGNYLSWSSSNSSVAPDLTLYRDGAADTLAQRRGTNAQTTRIYNTFTDASNYERFAISWNANTLELNTEAAGTGTKRNIVLNGANRAAYSTAAADLAACLVAHGLMAPEA